MKCGLRPAHVSKPSATHIANEQNVATDCEACVYESTIKR